MAPDDLQLAMDEAARILAACQAVAVSCHVNPDGDALGSAAGFARAAVGAGKDVSLSFGEPFELADYFTLLPLDDLVPPAEFPAAPEVMVTFDAADRDRLGSLGPASSAAGTLIVVDHHITNDGFGDINIIDPGASASAVLAFELLGLLGWPIDSDTALALQMGLVTDTGRFQYANTDARTFRAAAELVEAGAHPEVIGQHVYENNPFAFLSVAATVQQRAVLEPDLSLVWSELRKADLDEAGITRVEAEGLIDYIRVAREADIAVLLTEVAEGTKASLRSRAAADVGALAGSFGGGGHARAAGFTSASPPQAVIDGIREYLREQ